VIAHASISRVLLQISAALGAGIVYAFANPDFVGSNFPVVLITFALYGLAVIPFTYLICFLFVSHSTAQNVMIMIYLVRSAYRCLACIRNSFSQLCLRVVRTGGRNLHGDHLVCSDGDQQHPAS